MLLVRDVVQGGGVAQHRSPFDSHRGAQFVVGEPLLRDVAGGAGERVVDRQAAIEEQLASQLDLGPGEGIVGGHRNARQTEGGILCEPDEVHPDPAPIQQAARPGAVVGAFVAFLDVAGSLGLALVERLPGLKLPAGPRGCLSDYQSCDQHAPGKDVEAGRHRIPHRALSRNETPEAESPGRS